MLSTPTALALIKALVFTVAIALTMEWVNEIVGFVRSRDFERWQHPVAAVFWGLLYFVCQLAQ